jgi:phospho-N-acetylmuramoyl-pentapeptide-transferase
MLADLLRDWTGLALFDYLSFRAAMAALSAFVIALLLGRPTIAWLKALRVRDNVETSGSGDLAARARSEGKHNTPSMGGSFLVASLLLAVLLWADVTSLPVLLAILLVAGLAAVGFVDDYKKLTLPGSKGLRRGPKMLGLSLIAGGVLLAQLHFASLTGRGTLLALYPPFFNDLVIQPALWGTFGLGLLLLFQWLVVVGSANAANITDGLDGLAAGVVFISGAALTIFCYVTGRADWTQYLDLPYVAAAADMAVIGGALCGACLGFLWFNAYPAQVFMGDSGSLPLGGLLGWMALVAKQELVLPLIAVVLVVELGSSWLQTFWFRRTGGRRLFTCAPVHHGFQLYGGLFKKGEKMHEVKVVVRFWIVAAVSALISLALLKVR